MGPGKGQRVMGLRRYGKYGWFEKWSIDGSEKWLNLVGPEKN